MNSDVNERRIPIPPDFPVEWEEPSDADRFFERELQHIPGQMTTLNHSMAATLYKVGFNGGCAHYELPVRNTFRRINTYGYQSIGPVSHDPAELEELGRRAEQNLGAAMGDMLEAWYNETLPEVQKSLEFWESFDFESASNDELAHHLDASLEHFGRVWELHFITVIPVLVGMSMFDDLYAEVIGGDDRFASFRLLQGFDNHTLEADRALYALSRAARNSDEIRAALSENDTDAVLTTLESSDEGSRFLQRLRAYLEEWGKRHDGHFAFEIPSWIEDPTPVVENLRDYVDQPERDPAAELAELAAERERALADVRARLEQEPAETRDKFEFFLKAAQDGTILQENHNFWIDGRASYETRQVIKGFAARLAADGVIDSVDDGHHLTMEETREGLVSGRDLRALVADRKAELALFASVQEPPVLGTFPPGPPPDDPVARAIFKMFGGVPPESEEVDVITGMAGSAGRASGPARVIESLANAGELQAGEVLVAATTSPPWTPLFATAAAVVTDTGGILSHCAVVAREYGIPAVVGTKRSTASIKTGDLVEVDGDAGTIRIVGSH